MTVVEDSSEADRIRAKAARFAPPPQMGADGRTNLIGLSKTEIVDLLQSIDVPSWRAKQIWHWIYFRGENSFARMHNLGKPLQGLLEERFFIDRPSIGFRSASHDGTIKYLAKFRDDQTAETVYIPALDEPRGSVCLSSQIGCTLSCVFCHTGTQPLLRNLSAAEIVGQFMVVRDDVGEWPSPCGEAPRRLSNIVFMGMGEPLYNYDHVATAVGILTDGEGIGVSRRRITLSTSGVVPMMDRVGQELGVNLAVSLHAVHDSLRDDLVPLNRKYPLKELMAACRRFPGASNTRRITFEYVMLRGVNDSDAEARELVRLIAGLPAKVNLIPFNPWPGSDFVPSTTETLRRFAQIINDAGFAAPVREPRGRDILAACGQLKTARRPG